MAGRTGCGAFRGGGVNNHRYIIHRAVAGEKSCHMHSKSLLAGHLAGFIKHGILMHVLRFE